MMVMMPILSVHDSNSGDEAVQSQNAVDDTLTECGAVRCDTVWCDVCNAVGDAVP